MTTTTISRDAPGIYRAVSYVPGSVRFTCPVQERRTAGYRTWLGRKGMGWCVECLLCGQWESGCASRTAAIRWERERHASHCHAVQGCHCPQPHITAAMGARLGLGAEYPRHLGTVLFKLAGGRRKYRAPTLDLHKTPFGAPEGTYYYWR
jgi:hypothetical protein